MKPTVNSMRAHRRGFTLVELLVVITIIVVLAALSLMGARTFLKEAGAVKDAANVRAIWTGATLYASDHSDTLPGLSGALSRIDASRTWTMTDVDQLHPDVKNAAWKPDVPEGMAHGTYRLALYFDGSCGKVDIQKQPK